MSVNLNIYNQEGEVAGKLEVSDKIFAVKPKEDLIHQALIAQMANERQTLAHTKTKSEVRGGGRKPWRQKGTGRARSGSSRSPLWIGGGVTFGPRKDRNFKKQINQKMKQKAIFMVLSDKAQNENLTLLDELKADEFKTKQIDLILKNIEAKVYKTTEAVKKNHKIKRSYLIVKEAKDEKVKYSVKNLSGVELINLENINIYDLLKYKKAIFTKEAISKFQDIYLKK